ncbi:hypothetical protein [uncultured Cellulomonas sp.]|uniref:hypothetical protein n=1 Tax=uncultured Cellulomonas sp. TaxID=189682 RepID=UPI0028E5897D|nr:hypothetical protein [uncultured Cellulomonas sp.]
MTTATTTDPFPPARRTSAAGWVGRGITVLVLWAAWTFALGALLVLTGTAGSPTSRVVAVAVMLVALVPTWFLVRRARARAWVMGVAAVVVVALGLGLGTLGGPSLARMTSVGASLPVATGAQLLTTSSVENSLCLQECSRVTHLYAVPDATSAQAELGVALLADGWEAPDAGGYCRKGFGVRFSGEVDPSVEDPPAAPPGMELLTIEISRCGGP